MHPLNASPILDGVLPINKPLGMTSKDVSRWLEKRVGRIKMGHAGTLDPAATGVLPILVGRATKLQDYLVSEFKSYEFDVEFGVETDTLDSEGVLTHRAPWDHLDLKSIQMAAKYFQGSIEQVPPMHSAIKWKGKPLYEYARGRALCIGDMDQFKRKVFIQEFRVIRWVPPVATLQVTCSKGTYVRCLGRDLAIQTGTVGSLTRLTRTYASGFSLKECFSLQDLERVLKSDTPSYWGDNLGILISYIVPMNRLKLGVPSLRVSSEQSKKLLFGQEIKLGRDEIRACEREDDSYWTSILDGYMEDSGKGHISNQENSFRESPAVVVLSDDDRAVGIAQGVVLQDGQMTLKLRRGL